MRALYWLMLAVPLTVGCTSVSKSSGPQTSEPDNPATDSGDSTGDADADADADAGTDSGQNNGPRDPLEADCETSEGISNISGHIEGTPARMLSAAWYANDSGEAWMVLSPSTSACSLMEDFKTNTHELRALSIWVTDFSASHYAPIHIVPEPALVAGDGTPEAVVNGWEPIINLAVFMEHGLLTVRSASLGDTLQVTGLDAWSEFGDAAEGDFTACWCPAAEDFIWPRVEDSSPPAPPPVSE
jgi:hypothetical protein